METKELFTDGWSFLKTPLDTTIEQMREQEEKFTPVDIPHDWLIYDTENLYEDSFGWYRKLFSVKKKKEERIQLYFEGVYMDSTVYINGEHAGDWKYGYSSFTVDITDHVKVGENEVVVLVRHRSPNSRWYSGAGIYRKVWIKHCKKTYLPLNGTYVHITAPKKAPLASAQGCDFVMDIETEVAGKIGEDTECIYELWKDGECLKCLGSVKASEKTSLSVTVEKPLLWDVSSPNCYELSVELKASEVLYDRQMITVGFRTVEFTTDKGLFLNGNPLKVHGVCEHHDLGCLGAAVYKEGLRRQFEILREMGVNGLRTSHNMPAPEFMELADEMGFVVMSEAFDMWERPKTTYDYGRFFIEWAERDVESWIRRDRNHPSLLLWSIGNEIYDTHADEHGQEITRRLIKYVRAVDPKGNAPITIGSNYMPWEGAQKCADIVKYAGYNYSEKFYEKHHKEHGDWIIYGSETASVVQSRGIYHFPLSQSILADEDEQCSALGNSSTSWGADSIEKCIIDDRDATFTFGQFLWTGFDYIGEPTPYHTKNSYFGQIDTAGFPKDAYYIFQAEWTDVAKKPMVHLFPYWDFNPGQLVDVRATTNASRVELFVNDFSYGVKEINHKKGTDLVASWQLPYTPGTIEAVAYDENGKVIARDSHRSFGDSRQIIVSPNKHVLKADGEDLIFLTIETLDEKGRPVENARDYVTVSVDGPARLLGMDNGDSTDYEPYKCNTRKLFSGKLLAVLGATHKAGDISVSVTGEGLLPAKVLLESVKSENKGRTALENCLETHPEMAEKKLHAPARKVELIAPQNRVLTKEEPSAVIRANVYPENADVTLIWKVVNPVGIDVANAKIEEQADGENKVALLTALGDGEFRVRCMAKENTTGRITLISQMEYVAEGVGNVLLNPYELITGGLYNNSYGEVGNGNEKGFSTAREGDSGVSFDNVDFGEYGSDEITMPIFALDDKSYTIDIWLGKPFEKGSRILDSVVYQKPSIWNTYQEETWTLPERIKGVQTIGFILHDQKLHFKGFSFTYTEKSKGKLYYTDASRIYGDSYEEKENRLEKIGNNVTLEYDHMDFGKKGVTALKVCGRTPLEGNTIHFRFTPKKGETVNRMVEFKGTTEYEEQCFAIEKLTGMGRLDIIFLPGSQFDLEYIQFSEHE